MRPVEGQTPIVQGRIPDASPTPLETDEQVITQAAVQLARELGIKPDQAEATRWGNLHRQYPPLAGGIDEQQVRQYAQGKKDGTIAAMHASLNTKIRSAERSIVSAVNPGGTIHLDISTAMPSVNTRLPFSQILLDQGQNPPLFSISFNGVVMTYSHPLAIAMELVLATTSIEAMRRQERVMSFNEMLYGAGAAQASLERNVFSHAEQARAVINQKAIGPLDGILPEQLSNAAAFVRNGQNEQSLGWIEYVQQRFRPPAPQPSPIPARPTLSTM